MIWTTQPRSNLGALSAISAGQGPLVVLVHGVGLRAEAWNAQIGALMPDYRVLAVDFPGHGESRRVVPPASLAGYSDMIAELIHEPCVVAGHSMGAMIALDLADRHRGYIQGVAALNAIFRRSASAKAAVLRRAQQLDGRSVADPSSTLDRWFEGDQHEARSACDQWLRMVDPLGYQRAYQIFAQEDGPSTRTLETLDCPALFLTGENEPNSTPQMSEHMASLARNGTASVISGAAHMMPMTHADEVNSALRAFIGRCF